VIIRTKSPYLGKKKIWMKFISGEKEFEKYFDVEFQGFQRGEFIYKVDNSFPREMIKLIFGYDVNVKGMF
jgi:hypothetical protein